MSTTTPPPESPASPAPASPATSAATSPANISPVSHPDHFSVGTGPWQERLAYVVETMREMSSATDPESMVSAYGDRVGELVPSDRFVALSRRDLQRPLVRVTRSDLWEDQPNPWKEKSRLPVLSGGFFSDLIWGDLPVVIQDLTVPADDPAAPYCAGMRSLIAVPNYDRGEALNMVLLMREVPNGYNPEQLPEHVWMSNLFGRATYNLVLRAQVQDAYEVLDRELKVVADIQRSLLPATLPDIAGVELAADYQTSARAGGDYYDFFPLPGARGEPAGSPGGRWGILIADVSGHGTPAAVLMAVTHSIAHTRSGPPEPPSQLMNFVNRHLAARYTTGNGTFVTAFYGIYDPAVCQLTYACAGHPLPRVRDNAGRMREAFSSDGGGLPLGIDGDEIYHDAVARCAPGAMITFYTDGISEARNATGELFGEGRLDAALEPAASAQDAVARVRATLSAFTGSKPPGDDQTLIVARLTT